MAHATHTRFRHQCGSLAIPEIGKRITLMTCNRHDSVWDAIEETREQAQHMNLRSICVFRTIVTADSGRT